MSLKVCEDFEVCKLVSLYLQKRHALSLRQTHKLTNLQTLNITNLSTYKVCRCRILRLSKGPGCSPIHRLTRNRASDFFLDSGALYSKYESLAVTLYFLNAQMNSKLLVCGRVLFQKVPGWEPSTGYLRLQHVCTYP